MFGQLTGRMTEMIPEAHPGKMFAKKPPPMRVRRRFDSLGLPPQRESVAAKRRERIAGLKEQRN